MTTRPADLVLVTEAAQMLADAKTLPEIARVRNLANRFRDYAHAARLGLDAQNSAAAIAIEAEARAGELLARMEKTGERRARADGLSEQVSTGSIPAPSTLDDLGVTPYESSTWQAVARVPAEMRAAYVLAARESEQEVTRAGLLRHAGRSGNGQGHIAPLMTSSTDEWKTPPEVIAKVLRAFPRIDLDPCAEGGSAKNVPAARHYTAEDDGLSRDWQGRVFANPPYSRVDDFAAKLAAEAERIDEAIVLVPARTETRWWRTIPASHACFFHGRLKFVPESGQADGAATFPSAALYVGRTWLRFADAFGELGYVYERIR